MICIWYLSCGSHILDALGRIRRLIPVYSVFNLYRRRDVWPKEVNAALSYNISALYVPIASEMICATL